MRSVLSRVGMRRDILRAALDMLRWIPASLLVPLLAAAWVGGRDVAAGGDASQLASLPFPGSTNPRSFFFNDSVVVGYIPGAPILEVAAHDPQQGVVFYTLPQTKSARPALARTNRCLSCHESFISTAERRAVIDILRETKKDLPTYLPLTRAGYPPSFESARYRVTQSDLFLIGDIPGFTPQIARLVSMMNYTRSTTLEAVTGLGVDELDYLHDPQSNSIGTLLSHIAAAEVGYQAATFDARDLTAEEKQQWGAAIDLGERARDEIRGYELDHYLGRLEQVRARTLAELGRRDDQWLEEQTSFRSGQRVNNYFKWFHVLGHEINHRGQIRWLRSRATKRP